MARTLHRIVSVSKETYQIFCSIEGTERAASFAYYALFSLFPLIALLVTAGSIFFNSEEVVSAIQNFAPLGPLQQHLIFQMVADLQRVRGGASFVSLVVLIWSSLGFFKALMEGINRAWHKNALPWWQLPFKNFVMIIILASAMLIGMLTPVIIQALHQMFTALEFFLTGHFPHFPFTLLFAVLNSIRFGVSSLVLFYSFSMLYMLAPHRKVYFKQVWLPALLITILLQVSQFLFVNYLPNIIQYSVIYGTVGVLMFLLLWIYVSGIIILLGGCLCVTLHKKEENERAATAKPAETN